MKSFILVAALSLGAVGLGGMVDRGQAGIGEPSAPLMRGVQAPAGSTPALSATLTATPTPDYLPEPQPDVSRVLEPGETVRTLPLEVWRASLVISEANRAALLRITACESGGTWDTTLIGAAGEVGVAQVIPRFWGAVPKDLAGQFRQADRIYTAQGPWPWTTRFGCAIWSAQ